MVELLIAQLAAVMLGHVGQSEAHIWVQSDGPVPAKVAYWPQGKPEQKRVSDTVNLSQKSFLAHTFKLKDLQPAQQYRYEVLFEQPEAAQPTASRKLSFMTKAPDSSALRPLHFLVGSCFYLDDPVMKWFNFSYGSGPEIFETMAKEQAEAMFWTGDNVYFAPFDLSSAYNMNKRYEKHRHLPQLKNFWTKMPHYATWDDHDFGPNNASRKFKNADASALLFKSYWANPRFGGLTQPGIFFQQQWQDVAFFVTDNRTYRDPNIFPDPNTRRYFGQGQLDWLKNALLGSQATFKIVIMSSPVFNRYYTESFIQATGEFENFMSFLKEQKIEGVVFVSGDRHHSDLARYERPGLYPLYNYVNSPLTSTPTKILSEAEASDDWRVPGSLFQQRNYGKLRVEGPSGNRVLHLDTLDAEGKRLWTYKISEHELKHR